MQGGKPDDAARLFDAVLRADPKHIGALNLMSVVLINSKRFAEAENYLRRALEHHPRSDATLSNYGIVLKALNRPEEALRSFDEALKINRSVPDTWSHRGTILNDLQRYEDAIGDFGKAIALNPRYAEAFYNKGRSFLALKRADEALAAFERALATRPNFAEAWLGRGTALFQRNEHAKALQAFDRAIVLKRNLVEAWLGRGDLLLALQRYDDALSAYDTALALNHDLAQAWLGRGTVLNQLKRLQEALAAFDQALKLSPDVAEAWFGCGNSFHGTAQFDRALAAYQRALAINPNFAEAWVGIGNTFVLSKQPEKALAAYDEALRLKSDLKYIKGGRLHVKLQLSDWENLELEISDVLSAVRAREPAIAPSALVSLSGSAADQLKCAKDFMADQPVVPAVWRGEIYSHDRIRVGYFSADFRTHPIAQLMASVFEQHDKSRFALAAVSYGPDDGSDLRTRIKSAAENFIDARGMMNGEIIETIRGTEIDILVDLSGLTLNTRSDVLSWRVAPIQASFLGYPATMGADWIDYIIADPTVIPAENFGYYSEQVVWLPGTFQPNAYQLDTNKSAISKLPPTRAACDLPEGAFVFCCFNNAYKITPTIFDVWMRLLKAIPQSVLWVSKPNATAEANLGNEAERRGVSRERIVFASKLPELSDHLARHRHADLSLDTLPYNAHTTASDALWAGLPLVTCLSEAFAGRVAASLLKAVGLPELITTSLEDYEALALRLARDPALLGGIKDKLLRNRDAYPLFDTARFTRHLEAAYTTMWQRYQRGKPPHAFAVEA
ncbi:MAG: tetratricopeptide repeat protein [Xanthobacteraceae bacterium]